jgi:toxin-antitoxin system PIN domain toxin
VSATYLLDANALIALVIADHEHHDTAVRRVAGVDGIALCPMVEGAFVRFLVRAGERHATAVAALSGLYGSPRCTYWPDSISYTAADLRHVIGHPQVTDAYLAALAASRGCRLATFDRALAEVLPGETELIHDRSRTT